MLRKRPKQTWFAVKSLGNSMYHPGILHLAPSPPLLPPEILLYCTFKVWDSTSFQRPLQDDAGDAGDILGYMRAIHVLYDVNVRPAMPSNILKYPFCSLSLERDMYISTNLFLFIAKNTHYNAIYGHL